MSIFITKDHPHTCINLGIDIIKIPLDNIGNNYVLRFVICLLQPLVGLFIVNVLPIYLAT